MYREWQLQDAKAKFSEVVKHAVSDGPHMQESPLKGLKLDLERDKSPSREDPKL